MKILINGLGFALTIIGAFLALKNAPKHFTVIDENLPGGDWDAHDRKIARKNKLADYAVYLIIIGSTLQFTANFISEHS